VPDPGIADPSEVDEACRLGAASGSEGVPVSRGTEASPEPTCRQRGLARGRGALFPLYVDGRAGSTRVTAEPGASCVLDDCRAWTRGADEAHRPHSSHSSVGRVPVSRGTGGPRAGGIRGALLAGTGPALAPRERGCGWYAVDHTSARAVASSSPGMAWTRETDDASDATPRAARCPVPVSRGTGTGREALGVRGGLPVGATPRPRPLVNGTRRCDACRHRSRRATACHPGRIYAGGVGEACRLDAASCSWGVPVSRGTRAAHTLVICRPWRVGAQREWVGSAVRASASRVVASGGRRATSLVTCEGLPSAGRLGRGSGGAVGRAEDGVHTAGAGVPAVQSRSCVRRASE